MRNLALYDLTRHIAFGGLSDTNITDVLVANDTLYLVVDNLVYQSDLNGLVRSCVSSDHKCLTRICFMIFEQKLWFGTGKAFVYYCPISKVVEAIESPEEFSAAVWSPSQETLVVVSADGQVLVYSIDNVLKQPKCLGSCRLSDPITIISTNVGWGSVNTQFRGSVGKLSASAKKIEETVKEVHDKIPRIVWRSDQEYFLINYWTGGKRMFKVFQLPCVPVHVCEDTPGLQAPTSWRCTGNMIACPVYTDKLRILIFERNGLTRHSFDLHDQIEVIDLEWNSTGEILALHQKSDEQSYLSLYKISNYHWYLKQRLDFVKENPLTSFKWADRCDSIFELTVSTRKEILVYQFIYKVHRSVKPDSHGTCAVVDGNKVLMYYFAYAVIAPPDANEIVELKNPVSYILFNSAEHELLIIDCKYRCYLFSFEDKHFVNKEENDLQIPTDFGQYPHYMHHFYWKTNGNLYGVGMDADNEFNLFKYDCNFKLLDKDLVQSKINHLEFLNCSNAFLTLCDGGEIFLTDTLLSKRFSASSILHVETYICTGKLIIFSLNLANQFYINESRVAEDVTSFLTCSDYLYVTTQDSLYCLRLTMKEIETVICSGLAESCYSRKMEKGGVVICGFPKTAGVILQMPRGNLEVNSCRLAAIDKLDAFLDKGMWMEGFELIRTERLNTNLLVDLNPQRFLQQVHEFLIRGNSSNFLITFLLELVDENVLDTIYKTCNFEFPHNIVDKKKAVCEAIISCINAVDNIAHIRVAVMASVIIDDIDRAVEYLREIHQVNREENTPAVLKGLDCLRLYFSYEDICSSALLTYDTNFALFVYLQSSIDPKVYKPMIDELNACENEHLRRFKINDHLGLHSDAMIYLARDVSHRYLRGENYNAIDVSPLIKYATKYTLLADLYDMSAATGLFYTEVSLAYASYLVSQQLHKEAAIVYACAKFNEEALQQYKLCNQWKEAMIVLEKVNNLSETTKLVHVSEIAKGLESYDNYKDASFLYEVYLRDCELAVTVLIKGKLFREAMRVAQKFERSDLIDTIIQPTFKEFVENLFKKLNSSHASFNKHKSRLKIVRQKKIEWFLAEGNLDELEDVDNTGGNQSSSASVSSRTTRSVRSRSSTSTRSRRREELKKQDTREGGYYEDIALMRTLHQQITEIFCMGPEVGDLCHLLLLLKIPKMAKNLQNSLENVQSDMIQSLPEIWPANLNSFKAAATPELLALRENLEFLELSFRCPPEVPHKPWKVNLQ